MNIVLPRTLVEPGTIPWERISTDEPYMIIRFALARFMDGINDEVASGGMPEASRIAVQAGLRIIAKQNHAFDVWTTCRGLYTGPGRSGKHTGTIYEVYYRTHKNGPQYGTVVTTKFK